MFNSYRSLGHVFNSYHSPGHVFISYRSLGHVFNSYPSLGHVPIRLLKLCWLRLSYLIFRDHLLTIISFLSFVWAGFHSHSCIGHLISSIVLIEIYPSPSPTPPPPQKNVCPSLQFAVVPSPVPPLPSPRYCWFNPSASRSGCASWFWVERTSAWSKLLTKFLLFIPPPLTLLYCYIVVAVAEVVGVCVCVCLKHNRAGLLTPSPPLSLCPRQEFLLVKYLWAVVVFLLSVAFWNWCHYSWILYQDYFSLAKPDITMFCYVSINNVNFDICRSRF